MSKEALFSVEDWEGILKMVRIINDTAASDEDRIGAAMTLAEIVMDEAAEIVAMEMNPQTNPIGHCPKCGIAWYTTEGFCGGCEAVRP